MTENEYICECGVSNHPLIITPEKYFELTLKYGINAYIRASSCTTPLRPSQVLLEQTPEYKVVGLVVKLDPEPVPASTFTITIQGKGNLLPQDAEYIEDQLADFLEELGFGITGFIDDSITGNTTAFPRESD